MENLNHPLVTLVIAPLVGVAGTLCATWLKQRFLRLNKQTDSQTELTRLAIDSGNLTNRELREDKRELVKRVDELEDELCELRSKYYELLGRHVIAQATLDLLEQQGIHIPQIKQ
jgi:hypothetical protein